MPDISDYRFGSVVVDGQEHSRDVIVLPHRVVANWWRRDGHSLVMDDLADVMEELPPNLVVGSGAFGRMQPQPATIDELERRGITVEVLPTEAAVDRYRLSDPMTTAAALHLTC